MSGRLEKKSGGCLFLGILLFLCLSQTAWAEGSAASVEEASGRVQEEALSLLDEVDFSELDRVISREEGFESFDFRSLVESLTSGEDMDKRQMWESLKQMMLKEIIGSRDYMIQIVLLAVAFALLCNFANVFERPAVTDISFYMVYLLLMALLMKSFLLMSGILNEALGRMMDVMKALLPAFTLTMVLSTGTATAMGVYQLAMLAIFLIEAVLLYGVAPAVQIYVVLELMNYLTKEEMISKLTDLLKHGIQWVLKCLFTLVVGLNVIQGLLTPVIDVIKTSTLARTASMLPGFGNSVNAVAEIMVGSGMIIKNAVGTAGILVVAVLCVGPLVKIGVMTLMYKLSAAVVQPVADKRISGCIGGVGEGTRLLGKTMVTAQVMLLLTIALVTAATTWNH